MGEFVSMYVSGKLHTYPFPNLTFCLKREVSVHFWFEEGRCPFSQKHTLIREFLPRLLSTDRTQAELWTESLHNNSFRLLCVISSAMYTISKFSQLFPIHCLELVLRTFTLKSRFFSQNDPAFHLRDLPTATVEFNCKNSGRLIFGNFLYYFGQTFRTLLKHC